MKSAILALFMAFLATSAMGQSALQGTSGGFYVRTDASCFLQFAYTLTAENAILGQQYKSQAVQAPSTLPDGCVAQNFVFTSFFAGDTLADSNKLVPVAPTDAATNPAWNAYFNANWLYSNNGTGCVLLPQTSRAGLDQYLCSVNYNGAPLYFAVWGTGNFTFDASDASVGAWIKNMQNSMITGASSLVYTLNTSFPNISAHLYGSCGGNSSVISALNTLVTVTTETDLTANLAGVWLAYALVKKNSATASGDYKVVSFTSQAALFTPGSGTGCWSMGISYSDILSDMDYCKDGCKVSFVLKDNNYGVYVLETSGVQTVDSTTGTGNGGNGSGNGTDSGNGTGSGNGSGTGSGSGNGNGNGTSNGNGNGNGGNSGSASSAASMVFNAFLLLISVAYLAWF